MTTTEQPHRGPAAGGSRRSAERGSGARRRWLRRLLPILLLLLGGVAVWFLFVTRSEPERTPSAEAPTKVAVQQVEWSSVRARVQARGRVSAARRVELAPWVAGPVTWTSEELVPGGQFREGQALLRVDPTDYRLAAEVQRAEVRRAEVDLRRERNRRQASERALELYESRSGDTGVVDRPFVLNEPQLAAAEQGVQAARSRLRQARLDLKRTVLRAPFEASVESARVERGQRVSPQAPVVTLVGTDTFWVRTAIDVDEVPLIRIPGVAGETRGSPAVVSYRLGGASVAREGRVIQLLSDLDPEGTMARVLVAIDDPLSLEPDTEAPPLLIGALVQVEILGRMLEGVLVLPSRAIHEGDQLWVLTDDGRLAISRVDVVRRQRGQVLVRGALEAGARVVTSSIPLPVEGMRLEPQGLDGRGQLPDPSGVRRARADSRQVDPALDAPSAEDGTPEAAP